MNKLNIASWPRANVSINTLRPKQKGRHFPDDIFKCIFLNENVWISITISLTFVPNGPINNIPALVQVIAWHRPGDKPSSERMVVSLLTHICVSRPQNISMETLSDNFLHFPICINNASGMLAYQRLLSQNDPNSVEKRNLMLSLLEDSHNIGLASIFSVFCVVSPNNLFNKESNWCEMKQSKVRRTDVYESVIIEWGSVIAH